MDTFQDAVGFTDERIAGAEVALTAPSSEMLLSERTRAYAQLSHLRKARKHLKEAADLEPADADEFAAEMPR